MKKTTNNIREQLIKEVEKRENEVIEICSKLIKSPTENPPSDTRKIAQVIGKMLEKSNATVSYFIKEEEAKDRAYKELEAGIFGKYIAPAFNITKRYVGSEPICHVTRGYNETLSRILPKYGIEVKIIDRLSIDGVIVSASLVRKLIREDDWEKIKMLVPETTYSFLISPEAKKISDSIKGIEGRHWLTIYWEIGKPDMNIY